MVDKFGNADNEMRQAAAGNVKPAAGVDFNGLQAQLDESSDGTIPLDPATAAEIDRLIAVASRLSVQNIPNGMDPNALAAIRQNGRLDTMSIQTLTAQSTEASAGEAKEIGAVAGNAIGLALAGSMASPGSALNLAGSVGAISGSITAALIGNMHRNADGTLAKDTSPADLFTPAMAALQTPVLVDRGKGVGIF